MRALNQWAAILILTGISCTAAFAGDANAGKEKSLTCQACHGVDGLGIDPQYPILAGQYADYLEHSLRSYRDGTRNNAIMAGFATTLTDEDIADLSAYYSELPGGVKTLPKR